ncbi:MAG: nitronate monooxygenase [Sciscionella sp.]
MRGAYRFIATRESEADDAYRQAHRRTSALELLLLIAKAVVNQRPVLLAGGSADAAGIAPARNAGADGVLAGTHFVLTEESDAHSAYRARISGASNTIETRLFGLGWSQRHRRPGSPGRSARRLPMTPRPPPGHGCCRMCVLLIHRTG